MGLPSRKLERRCELFGEKPLIILRLDSWLQLDFVHSEHLWHCRSSPLLTNHLSHLLVTVSRLAPSGRPAISLKRSSRPAGLRNSRTVASTSVEFHIVCTMPRGLKRNPPSSTTTLWSPIRPPMRPRNTKETSSSSLCE